jgi:hypothetical protein
VNQRENVVSWHLHNTGTFRNICRISNAEAIEDSRTVAFAAALTYVYFASDTAPIASLEHLHDTWRKNSGYAWPNADVSSRSTLTAFPSRLRPAVGIDTRPKFRNYLTDRTLGMCDVRGEVVATGLLPAWPHGDGSARSPTALNVHAMAKPGGLVDFERR